MVGTLFNTVTVIVGASAGLALGAKWSKDLKDKIFAVIGLFTLAIGAMMALETEGAIDLFLALVLGTVLGHSLHLQARIDALTQRASRGFMEAFMLFCLGSMTLVGCMEDGLLGKPNLLFIKGTMDLISSAFLAATLGRGVLWSAAGVLGFQGALTLGFMALGEGMDPALIRELSALGGILMLGIAFQLWEVRANGRPAWPLVDALPALLLLPLVRVAHTWLETAIFG